MPAYTVGFCGGRLSRNARGALSAAGITPISGYPRGSNPVRKAGGFP